MMHRRDAQPEESIPLPIEMVYNSFTDTITDVDPETGYKSYFKGNSTQFNRIYFRYPPEWITSDVGEKIIGVRNMKISIRQRMGIEFTLYIRKYRQDKFKELAAPLYDDIEDLKDDEIQDVVNRMNPNDVKVFKIDYREDIYDDIDDFIQDVYDAIDRETLYFKLRDAIYESEQTKDEKIAAQEQLEKD